MAAVPGAGEAEATPAPIAPGHEKLFEAYRNFITTGPDAVDTTEAEVTAAFQAEIKNPQGLLTLTALTEAETMKNRCWKTSAPANGKIDFSAYLATFHLDAFTICRSVDGTAVGAYPPSPGLHLNGTLHYNELTALEGIQYITIGFKSINKFYIDFSTSADVSHPVARFTQTAPGFYFPSPKPGSAKWVPL
ncbi:hypothetical protein F5X96DRAFT_690084 [Biscogniauxia mediterranea]|nr:hypothetical protein F5X96DRAFT_690084 [Biscogniauxia mediterranea]